MIDQPTREIYERLGGPSLSLFGLVTKAAYLLLHPALRHAHALQELPSGILRVNHQAKE